MLRQSALVALDIAIGASLALLWEAYRRKQKLDWIRVGNLVSFVALDALFRI
jgi:hypothetical protein